MTPYEIRFMLHCFTSCSQYEDSTVKDHTIERFVTLDLIQPKENYYICTGRGVAFVDMLMSVPLPELIYINPETNKQVGK